jgi:UDP-glucose 4-epimerase
MNVLVTGGAGFIGRWLVKQLMADGHCVTVLDNLSSGSINNIEEFLYNGCVRFVHADINDPHKLSEIFCHKYEICYHLAASINVQDSIDDPKTTFENDVIGTFYILEEARKHRVKVVFMSTCMVYDRAISDEGIRETDPVKPASPYAGAKLAAESMVLSYFYTFKLPTVVIRPFNTYGPFQKINGEGGVVATFIKRKLTGEALHLYGDGTQTRDLLYVEDCARFVTLAGYSSRANGNIIHAGFGEDISINELAEIIVGDKARIKHVPHIHPQSEISKLKSINEKAKEYLGWKPIVVLKEGINRTEEWIKSVESDV